MPSAESPTATFGPSFDEIVAHFAPTNHRILEWLDEVREFFQGEGQPLDMPLRLGQLLRFSIEVGTPTGDEGEPFEDLEEFVEEAQRWGVERWLERAGAVLPVAERVFAAVELASTWWVPVLRPLDPEKTAALERLLAAAKDSARDRSAPRALLEEATKTRAGLPPSRPPPPYVGHFCAAVTHLVAALVTDPIDRQELAAALEFAHVAPDGSQRFAEIAAMVEGKAT